MSDGMMMTRAYNALENVISIDDIHSSNRDDCFCIGCGGQLTANKGKIKAHYFAHRPNKSNLKTLAGYDSTMVCNWSSESEVHIMAKEYIANTMELLLPIGTINPIHKIIEFSSVKLEKRLNGRVPDIIASINGERILIEIAVMHKCDNDKIKELRANNLNCIEIDLKNYKRTGDIVSHEQIKALMSKANAKWLSVSASNQFGGSFHTHDKEQFKKLNSEYKNNKHFMTVDITARGRGLESIKSDIESSELKLISINENIAIKGGELDEIKSKIADINICNLISRESSVLRNEKLNNEERNRLLSVRTDLEIREVAISEVEDDLACRTKKLISLESQQAELAIKIASEEEAIRKRRKKIHDEVNLEARVIAKRKYDKELERTDSALNTTRLKIKKILNKTKSILPTETRLEILEMIN